MNLDQFVDWAQAQPPLLYPPNPPEDAGQCYQLINFYLAKVWGTPIIWRLYAYQLLEGAAAAGAYEVIYNNPNDPNQLPPRGAVVVYSQSTPGSGGMGHTDIFLQSYGTGVWVGLDSNWGGNKVAHKVTHNWSYVAGWFFPKTEQAAAASAPQGGIEMIADEAQARQAYGLLRLDGAVSPEEISSTAGQRSWEQFAVDAQPEIAGRNSHFGDMQNTINSQNQTISDLTTKLTDAGTTVQEKQQALKTALEKIASDNTDMATLHDKITEYDNNPVVQAQAKAATLAKQPSNVGKLFASFLSAFGKFKVGSKKP